MNIEPDSRTTESRAKDFDEFINKYETTLQLHALRYEASERSHELFAKSAVTLNGGALLAILTTARLESGGDLAFAAWFILGTISFLLGTFARYNAKRILMNSPISYYPEIAEKDDFTGKIRHNTNLLGEVSIWCLFLSLLAFAIGCGHGFLVMSGT